MCTGTAADDVAGDVELEHFDTSVAHDVDVGMVGMLSAATEAVKAYGSKLRVVASPWSPPAWMKLPVNGVQSMLASAKPNGESQASVGVGVPCAEWTDRHTRT